MDNRETIVKQTLMSMQSELTAEQVEKLKNTLYLQLDKYEVQERCTDLIPADDTALGALKKFIASKRLEGSSERTLDQYALHCSKMLETIGKDVDEITTYDLRFYLAEYKETRHVSNTTLEHIRRCIGSFFSWLCNEGMIETNPCAAVEKIKLDKKILKPFSAIEMEKLRRACTSKRDRALIEFLYATGCRVSEVVLLNRQDIDWNHRQVVVLGKGAKYRTVYLTDISVMYLQEYLESRTDCEMPLFYSQQPTGGHRLTKSGIERLLHVLGDRAGVDDVHPHKFRRTFATNMIEHGASIQNVATMMGHDDISTTQVYCYISQQTVEAEYKRCIA